ncbi:hypothetical protein ACHAPU_010790 [Fusarium lateritium]
MAQDHHPRRLHLVITQPESITDATRRAALVTWLDAAWVDRRDAMYALKRLTISMQEAGMALPALYVYGGPLWNMALTKRNIENIRQPILDRFRRQPEHPFLQAQVVGFEHHRPLIVRPPILTTLETWDERNSLVSRTSLLAPPPPPPPPPQPAPPQPAPSAASSNFGDEFMEDARGHSSSPSFQPSSDAGRLPLDDDFGLGAGPIDLDLSDDELPARPDDFAAIEDDISMASIDNAAHDALDRIRNGEWLNDIAIENTLQALLALQPIDAVAVNPVTSTLPRALVARLQRPRVLSLFLPLYYSNHWTLFVLFSQSQAVTFYDSLPSGTSPGLVARLEGVQQGLLQDFDFDLVAAAEAGTAECPRQMNGDDCGVAVVVNALYVLAGRPLPSSHHCDFSFWRQVFIALLVNDEPVNTLLLPEHLAEPTVALVQEPERPDRPLSVTEYLEWDAQEQTRRRDRLRQTADAMADFVTSTQSRASIVAEIVAVLSALCPEESPVLGELGFERENTNNALTCLRACIEPNQEAERLLQRQLDTVNQRVAALEECRDKLRVLLHQYEQDHADLLALVGRVEQASVLIRERSDAVSLV